jgi:uncharacterized protein DUF3291
MLISVTRLRVRSFRYLPLFIFYSLLSASQAKRAAGNYGTAVLRERNNTFWTRTAWSDESSMRAFMMGGIHRRAMPRLLDWCDEASVVHWSQDSSELPGWQEAHRRMVDEGRPSKVKHPSPAHLTHKIPEPKVS